MSNEALLQSGRLFLEPLKTKAWKKLRVRHGLDRYGVRGNEASNRVVRFSRLVSFA